VGLPPELVQRAWIVTPRGEAIRQPEKQVDLALDAPEVAFEEARGEEPGVEVAGHGHKIGAAPASGP